ncbi:MAG: hypothetical protein IJV27_12050 [Prevotella sp.]|nr:hypothetical protein [Prevotella sp.]
MLCKSSARINFTPTTERIGSNGTRTRTLANSLEFHEWGDKSKDGTDGE